eukprot:TCONS_00006339-protein
MSSRMKILLCCYLFIVTSVQAQSNWWGNSKEAERNNTTIPVKNPFPLADFLEITNISRLLSWKGLQCQSKINPYDCECQRSCQNTGSCCIDYLWNHNEAPITNTSSLESAKAYQKILDSSIKEMSCLPFFPFSTVIKQHFIMVSGCSESATATDKQKCINSEGNPQNEQIPVLGKDQYLYKNEHCAKCNGILVYKYEKIEIFCDESLVDTKSTDFKSKTIFELLEQYPKGCSIKPSLGLQSDIIECQLDFCPPVYASYCSIIAARFHPVSGIFSDSVKNVYCFKCNGGLVGPNAEVDATFETYVHGGGWSKTVDMNELMNKKSDQCLSDEVRSSYGDCIPMLCGFGYELLNRQCVKTISGRNISNSLINISTASNDTTFVQKCLPQIHQSLALYIFFNSTFIEYVSAERYVKDVFEKHQITGDTMFILQDSGFVIQSPVITTNLSLLSIQKEVFTYFGISKIVLTPSIHNLPFVNTLDLSKYFEGGSKLCAFTSKQSIPRPDTPCEILGTDSKLILEIYRNGSMKEKIDKCHFYYLDSSCFRQELKYKDFSVENSSKVLTITTEDDTVVSYSPDKYAPNPITNGFEICIPNGTESSKSKYPWQETINDASYIISLIGTIASIVSHSIFIILFYLVRPLRNTGGLYVLVLVIFLLASDLIFIISINLTLNTGACKCFGILLYETLLLVCCWTIVVAFDMTLKFTSSFDKGSSDDPQKTLRKRILIVLLLCTGLTLLVVTLNETDVLDFAFEQNCWIGNSVLRIGFYFVPIVISYTLCIVDLAILIYSIYKAKQSSKNALGDSKSRDISLLYMAIKLIIILGITEILGLIQIKDSDLDESEAVFNSVFGIFYDITRSLRGVLIFVVYMLNEKTLKLIKNELKKRRKREIPYRVTYTADTTHSNITTESHS